MSTVKTNQLINPVVARYVRILPTAWKTDICLRAEFYGCPGTFHGNSKKMSFERLSGRVVALSSITQVYTGRKDPDV